MKPFAIIDCAQGTPDWLQARAGRATASRAKHIVAKGRGSEESTQRRDYRMQLVLERLVGRPMEDPFVNDDMARGTALEPEARSAYEVATGQIVNVVGFVAHTELPIGCSPDGVLGEWEGLVQFKCPKSATHMRYLREAVVPPDYVPQLQHEVFVTGAHYIDFVSYDPRFPEELQLFVVRVEREKLDLGGYEKALRAFLADVEKDMAAIEHLRAAKQLQVEVA